MPAWGWARFQLIHMTNSDRQSGDGPDTSQTDEPQMITIQFKPAGDTWRRVQFEPRADDVGWLRFDEEWTGCRWRPVGSDIVTDLQWTLENSKE